MIALQKELFDLARNGDLLIEYTSFVSILSKKLKLSGRFLNILNTIFRIRMRGSHRVCGVPGNYPPDKAELRQNENFEFHKPPARHHLPRVYLVGAEQSTQ
jgi:hypothetical protein